MNKNVQWEQSNFNYIVPVRRETWAVCGKVFHLPSVTRCFKKRDVTERGILQPVCTRQPLSF